jgi:hypothetical protein
MTAALSRTVDTPFPPRFPVSYPLVLVTLFVALFCVNLLIPRDLWMQDEARYGEVVREMLATGNWLIPHLNGHPYPDKPALYFWIVAFTAKFLGLSEISFRLLSVLATLGAITGIYQLGQSFGGRASGFWAASLFMTSWLGLIGGHMVRMDMLVVAAAVYAWLNLHRYRESGKYSRLIAFWAFSALALAIKGPITLLFTVLPGIVWYAAEEGREGLKSIYPLSGLVVLIGLVGLWATAVVVAGYGEYLDDIWHKQLVGRSVDSWSHREPFYFYLWVLPLVLMPWTGLAFQGQRLLWRERPVVWKELLAFTLLPLLGLSLISGKLFIYLLPLLPGLCIAAALAALQLAEQPRVSPWFAWPPVFFLVIVAVAMLWFSWTYLSATRSLAVCSGSGLLVLAGIGLGLGYASVYCWLWGWLGLSIAAAWLTFGAFAYAVNPLFSARELGTFLAQYAAPGASVGVVNATRGILNYYADRIMVELQRSEAAEWFGAHKGAVLIVKTSDLKYVFGEGGPRSCQVDASYFLEFKEYHVLVGC